MAESSAVGRMQGLGMTWRQALTACALAWCAVSRAEVPAQGGSTAARAASATSGQDAAASAAFLPKWVAVPRIRQRLHASDIGLVINTADPYSVRVGEHYVAARKLSPAQVLRIDVPAVPVLKREEFEALRRTIDTHFGPATQALALAWVKPYAVECNAITGALALGFDAELCRSSCAASRPSTYFNSASARPLSDHGWRPSMLLAAESSEQALAMIDRGVEADGLLLKRGRPSVNALMLTTADAARSVRVVLYPPPGLMRGPGVLLRVTPDSALPGAERLLLAITGSVRLPLTPAPDWVPGGLGDHLTSVGGSLAGNHTQSTALEWIASGATASHGAVSEPCNHLQKFPHPQVLLLHYLQGATALEAYWKSVAWPQQSLFIGEPLAAPFALR
jgi:uncharacterized protein (TIGR03790 family)